MSDQRSTGKKPCACDDGESTPAQAGGGGALTRRKALKSAGAAVALGASGGIFGAAASALGAEPLPPQNPPPTTPTLPWDIRNQVQDAASDPASIQAVYDDINRMNILIGDIPFGQLFKMRMRRLVPLLESRLPTAQQYGLISDPTALQATASALLDKGPRATVSDFYVFARSNFSKKGLRILVDLRREGIRVPLPGSEKGIPRRAKVIDGLMKHASSFTFHEYYTVPQDGLPAGLLKATALARSLGLLGWGKNDRCCAYDKNTFLHYCTPRADSFCALADTQGGPQKKNGIEYGICIDASTNC